MVMIKVLIRDGTSDTFSEVYSQLNRSEFRYGIPVTRIYPTRNASTAKVITAAMPVSSARTPEPGCRP